MASYHRAVRARSGGRRCGRAYGWLGPLLATLVLLIGLASAWLAATGVRDGARDAARRAMDQRTAVARDAVVTETARYLDLLRTAAAGAGTPGHLTAAGFRAATLPFTRARLTGVTSVAFVVPAASAEVADVQRAWRAAGATGLTLMPQPAARDHYFTVFSRPLNGNPTRVPGVDLAGSPEAVAALAESRRTGMPTVSDAYVLLVDRTLPQARQTFSFVLSAAVFGVRADGGGQGDFRGWLLMGLRGQELLSSVLGTTGQGLLDGELQVTNADGRRLTVAGYTARGSRDVSRSATFPVGNRHWTLTTGADSSRLPGGASPLPDIVLYGGVAGSALLAGLVWVLGTGRARAQARVEVATAELREAEAEARRQAGLLGAIMASIGDGVGVIDSEGRFLLHNPAAKQLLGISDDIDGPGGWQEHYGLYRPDGTTPFPPEEMPLVRGLHGESVNGVEMVVRNARRPDGLLISVDGRPLDPSAGQNGAVAVFHDITELRRYERDLSVFAGVVAHDLKAPLAVIRGHCEMAGEVLGDLSGSPAADEAIDALRRITGAVDRMAALIDTLLAYTTARDAPLRLRDLPLGPLVADVVAERTGHLRAGVDPIPDIYVGPLPVAVADPAMLRHVIDNLIGNALKYVQPGRHPRVDVTAGPAPEGRVRLDVADRGIGIPDEDKPRIFDSFHRAHTEAGYAGTGLGLAICQRIVERHGGSVAVADNPGGGTRFEVTLPAGQAAASRPVSPPAPAPADAAHSPAAAPAGTA
jgi:signal transduction histidine kinase